MLTRDEIAGDLHHALHLLIRAHVPISTVLASASPKALRCALGMRDDRGRGLVHVAAACGRPGAVTELLAAGEVAWRDGESGWTALHVAAWGGRVRAVREAIVGGVAVGSSDFGGEGGGDVLVGRFGGAADGAWPGRREVCGWGSDCGFALGMGGGERVGIRRCGVGGGGACDGKFDVVGMEDVATGMRHSLFLCEGEVWGVGLRKGGRIGGKSEGIATEPEKMNGVHGVAAVAASGQRSALLTKNGNMVVLNEGMVKCGLGQVQAVGVGLGDRFWIAWDERGGCWGGGENLFGSLGMDETVEVVTEQGRRVPGLARFGPVRKVAVARGVDGGSRDGTLVAAVFRSGEVVTWGGQAGRTARKVGVSGGVGKVGKAVDVAVGQAFLVFATECGRVAICPEFQKSAPLIARIIRFAGRKAIVGVVACGRRVLVHDAVGEVYEGDVSADGRLVLTRVEGVRGVSRVDIGRGHALCVLEPKGFLDASSASRSDSNEESGSDDGDSLSSSGECSAAGEKLALCGASDGVLPSLVSICENGMLSTLSISSVIDLLRLAIDVSAPRMRDACLHFLVPNFDRVLGFAPSLDAFLGLDDEHLLVVEEHLRGPGAIEVEEAQAADRAARLPAPLVSTLSATAFQPAADLLAATSVGKEAVSVAVHLLDLQPYTVTLECATRRLRAARKKLGRIESIEARVAAGEEMQPEARRKLLFRGEIERTTQGLEAYIKDERFASPVEDEKNGAAEAVSPPASFPPGSAFIPVVNNFGIGDRLKSLPGEESVSSLSPTSRQRDPARPVASHSFIPASVPSSSADRVDRRAILGPDRTRSAFSPVTPEGSFSPASSIHSTLRNDYRSPAGSLDRSPIFTPLSPNDVGARRSLDFEAGASRGPIGQASASFAGSPTTRRKGKNRKKLLVVGGLPQSQAPSSSASPPNPSVTSPNSKSGNEDALPGPRPRQRSVFRPVVAPASSTASIVSSGAWGAESPKPKPKLSLKDSLASGGSWPGSSSRQSLLNIQQEQEKCRESREYNNSRVGPLRTGAPSHLSANCAIPTPKLNTGQVSMASFIAHSAPHLPSQQGGAFRQPSAAISIGSPGTSAWSGLSMASSEESRPSSFREIQMEEEIDQRTKGYPSAGAGSPGCSVWMPLPGDYRPVGKPLKDIEREELTKRNSGRAGRIHSHVLS